jgi:chromatin structure-remodeling complex subunit SFH1
MGTGMNIFNSTTGVETPRRVPTPRPEKVELDQSYLGMVPPAKFIKPRLMAPTAHEYP